MQSNFEKSLKLVLVHEGGFANHPRDPGGETMKGVTLSTFRSHFGHTRTVDDLKRITDEQLATVYRKGYWDQCKCDDLPAGLDYCVFDAAVNSGPRRASQWLQRVLGVPDDGWVGPVTLGAIQGQGIDVLVDMILDTRLRFMQSLSTWTVFGVGWSRRIEGVRKEAKAMLEKEAKAMLEKDDIAEVEALLAESFIAWLRANKELIKTVLK